MSESSPKKSARRPGSLWMEALLHPSVWRRAFIFGFPVGLLQAVINQGDFWWHHEVNGVVITKTIVSPIVTFSVALLSAAATFIERQRTVLAEKNKSLTSTPSNVIPAFGTTNYDRIEI